MHNDSNAIDHFEQDLKKLGQLLAHGPELSFQHNASVQEVRLRAPWTHTLAQAWSEAYAKLGEAQKPSDRLQSVGGIDMTPHLQKAILELYAHRETRIDEFEIIGPTGGAAA